MRIAIIGDAKQSGGGNQNWAVEFANIMKEYGVKCDYIGDSNFSKESRLYDIAVQSPIESDNYFKFLKTPAEVITKMSYCQRRLYEQLRTKVYDAYIIQRVDFLPIVQSFNLSKKVPIYIPTHDISIFENIVFKSSSTTETPYRMVEMNEHFMKSDISILATSTFLQNQLKSFNGKLTVEMLPIPLNKDIEEAKIPEFDKTEGVLWVGSQTSYKNPDMMFEIVKGMPDIKFTMVFNTKDAGTFTKITKKYKAKNLTVLKSQPLDDLIELYASHRIGIVTSSVETFCIVAQEHLCFHPTIVNKKSINQYHNIFDNIISFEGVKGAIEQINTLYNDKQGFIDKVNASKENIVEIYSKENVKVAYKDFLIKLKDELREKNSSGKQNTLGALIESKLGVVDELEYEHLLQDANYLDYSLAQHSILSQLQYFKRKEYKNKTVFCKL